MESTGLQGYVMLHVKDGELYISDNHFCEPQTLGQIVSAYIDYTRQFPAYISIDVTPLDLGLNEYDPNYFKVGGTD